MRFILTLLTTLLSLTTWANMASPVQEGTWAATPFISQHVDITKEKILIIPDNKFETALFKIEYHIKANKSGKQIPLLFYASEFKENFKIWIDDKEIKLSQVPEAYKELEGTPFNDFGYFFESRSWSEIKQVLIETHPSGGFYVSINDLKFFETDMTEGNHLLRIEYTADQWVNKRDWVKEYSFRYVLSPAKYWKSFGSLEITINNSNFDKAFTTNLGTANTKKLQSRTSWTFSSLPTEVVQLTYKAEPSLMATILISISPAGLTLILTIILIAIHVIVIRQFRKIYLDNRFSLPMIAGSIIIPFLILLGYMFAYTLIDAAIGQEAGKFHGYTFLILFLYPIFLPIYWTGMWLLDKKWKKELKEIKMNRQQQLI